MKKIAIFASGTGTNAKKIIQHLTPCPSSGAESKTNAVASVTLIVCNKTGADVLKIAEEYAIPSLIIEKEKFFRGNAYVDDLQASGIDFIVLAGFLWKIPAALLRAFPNHIINIHPALLPKYGGKGMYGNKVHQAVIDKKEKESGITIHYIDDIYDNGEIIFQARCPVQENDTAESLAQRIHKLEHEHYPKVIAQLLSNQ